MTNNTDAALFLSQHRPHRSINLITCRAECFKMILLNNTGHYRRKGEKKEEAVQTILSQHCGNKASSTLSVTYNFPSLKERTKMLSFFTVTSSWQSGEMTLLRRNKRQRKGQSLCYVCVHVCEHIHFFFFLTS